MTITAKFSNGFEDEYKGKRDVKAAWMVTWKDTGKVFASGHSLDRKRAAGTARGNITQRVHTPNRNGMQHPHAVRAWAERYGCRPHEVLQEAKRRMAAYVAEFDIEVVDI